MDSEVAVIRLDLRIGCRDPGGFGAVGGVDIPMGDVTVFITDRGKRAADDHWSIECNAALELFEEWLRRHVA